MLLNNIKLAFRNLGRNRAFTAINVLGLALGLAVFVLIMLWVAYETGYNNFHESRDRIAAVMSNRVFENGEIATYPAVPSPMAAALQKDLPGIEKAATTSWGDQRQFKVGEKSFLEMGLYVSPEFLDIFSFPLLKGDPVTSLSEPHSVLLTETLARKYFDNEDPLGKTISVGDGIPYKVTGILKDLPDQTTFHFDFLMPMQDYIATAMGGQETWEYGNTCAYVKIREGADRAALDKAMTHVLTRYTDKQPGTTNFLWNLDQWYLKNDFKNGKYAGGGRIVYVRLFIIIAIFILLLACINFMNLSTARAASRAKEVGVRKVIGAARGRLVGQFMTESLLLSLIAGILALALLTLVLPAFNTHFRKSLSLDISDGGQVLSFAGILFVTGLLAGVYPAFFLSSFNPTKVIKSLFIPVSAQSNWVRKGLVVLQFTVSILLIIGTIVVTRQVDYIQNRNLGYNKDHLVWFPNNMPSERNEAAMQEIRKVPGVKSVSQASVTFTSSNNRGSEVNWPGKNPGQDILFSFIATSHDIVQTMELEVIEGRGFRSNYPADTGSVLLNEEAVKRMGLQKPVGQTIELYSGKVLVVGVVKDFHTESLHQPIAPVIISCRPDWTWNMYVRTDGKDIQRTMKGIEDVYKAMAPGLVFEFNFQDKEYERLYRSETQVSLLVKWFAGLALVISILGLLGLTMYTVERRRREIGIRKVLGAPVSGIIALISKQFIWLVGLSMLIAITPAVYVLNNWLGQYAYRIGLEWWVFVAAGGLVLFVAMCTIWIQAAKTAMSNPVKSLRTE